MRCPLHTDCGNGGTVEFLFKPFRDDVLLSAIGEALERSRVALGLGAEMQVLRDCYASLSPRERKVMRLVVSCLLNKQVGWDVGTSEITVKAHRGNDAKDESRISGRSG